MNCPICNSERLEELMYLKTKSFDGSTLYEDIKILNCINCGHIFNQIENEEDLMKYYNEEYGKFNLDLKDDEGDRPGSNNKNSNLRYEQFYDLIKNYIREDHKILDIGCANGGFIKFLREKGFENVFGIEIIKDYVDEIGDEKIIEGNIYSIPFDDETFDVIIMDQVLEHIVNLKKGIHEVKRVLKNGGLVCVGVPDASRYCETEFFEYYWFLLREHVQHFDFEHLKMLLENEGFIMMRFSKYETPMVSEKMILPNINAIFFLNTDCKYKELRLKTKNYILTQSILSLNRGEQINNFLKKLNRPIYVWGIGREFLYLWKKGLNECNIKALIDDTKSKQERHTIDGFKIHSSEILREAEDDSYLLITAFAHFEKLKKRADEIGFRGRILYV